jgi:hypothetical protein
MAFKWGVEFETGLLLHDPNGKNRRTLWESGDTKITSESFTVEHLPNIDDQKFWITGVPEDKTTRLYNLEAQMGVFSGMDGLPQFETNLKNLAEKLKKSVRKNRFNTSWDQTFPLFVYDYLMEKDNLFLDKNSSIPGAYPAKKKGWIGYRSTLRESDIYGVPQLTTSFNLAYLPKLFDLLYNSNFEKYEEFQMDYANNVMEQWNLKYLKCNEHDANELYGFILYLFHYYGGYLKYLRKKNINKYLKNIFWLKPRTNPATLYASFTKSQRSHLKTLIKILDDDRNNYTEDYKKYVVYLIAIITKLEVAIDKKECVYVSDIADIPNGLYRYDMSSYEIYVGMDRNPHLFTRDIPCVDQYQHPEDEEKDLLPTISYGEDEEFYISSGGFTGVWEWKTSKRGEVAFEFRRMRDLFKISLDMEGEGDNPQFAEFFEANYMTTSQLSEMMSIIFNSFMRYVFTEGTSKSKNKCKEGKHRSRKTGRCRISPKKKPKCKEGKRRSGGRCRSPKKKSLRKCKEGKRRSGGRCRSPKKK